MLKDKSVGNCTPEIIESKKFILAQLYQKYL